MTATAQDGRSLVREVLRAGSCTNPIKLVGHTVNLATGELRDSTLRVPCKDRRAAVCPACSYLYKADAWIIVSTGISGGKGLPESVDSHPRLFVTLTAPGFGAVHTRTTAGDCRNAGPEHRCAHGRPTTCRDRHDVDDPVLGQPLCEDCFDYEASVLWNATASKLWDRTMVRLRQSIGARQGIRASETRSHFKVSYLKVAEVQRRGLIHFHAIIRADGPDGPDDPPPAWLTSELITETLANLLPSVTYRSDSYPPVRWGAQFDIVDITDDPEESRRIASYAAKYSVKTSDGSEELARRFRTRRGIQRALLSPHAKRLALTAWDLDRTHPQLRLKIHAHTFGFRGQLITKSVTFSTTFAKLRQARSAHMRNETKSDPVAGTFFYVGRGYSDPRATEVAEMIHGQVTEHRQEQADARRRSRLPTRWTRRGTSRGTSRSHSRVEVTPSAKENLHGL